MHKRPGSGPGSTKVRKPLVECYYLTLRGLEYLHAQRVLEMCGGSRAKASKVLGVERTALRRYLARELSSQRR